MSQWDLLTCHIGFEDTMALISLCKTPIGGGNFYFESHSRSKKW